MAHHTKYCYTPPEIAKMLHLSHEKVLTWIRLGELKSRNLRTARHGQRPRYVVLHTDLMAFLDDRLVRQEPHRCKTRRRANKQEEAAYY